VLVRPAAGNDIDAIADVYVDARAGMTYLPKLHTDEETRRWIHEEMVSAHEVWVAEVEGDAVGFAALAGDSLGHLYVRPSAQNCGVGATLLGRVKSERTGGFSLWVFQCNEGARRFYERHGCRLVELTDGSDNEEREPDARYEWRPAAK
jgi:GNAT superfamily N-acetyltransferase